MVVRVLDQGPEFLRFAAESELVPGRRLEVVASDPMADTLEVVLDDGRAVHIGARAAVKVRVRAAS